MATKEELLTRLKNAILTFDGDAATTAGKEIVASGVDPVAAITTMGSAMGELGAQFEAQEVYLPELVIAADAMKAVIQILEPEMLRTKAAVEKLGKIVIGTVKGDVHSLGKDIVGTMLMVAGFEVIDLGVDVSPSRFIDQAKAINADIIACSALMSTTLAVQKDVVEALKAMKLRDSFKLLVGGGVASLAWAEQIGADGYAPTANDAINVAKELLGK